MVGNRIEFLESQVAYYKSKLGCGNFHDKNMIVGLYHKYQAELRKEINGMIGE